jgi:hypothetical protein
MPELSMATSYANLLPPVILKDRDRLVNFLCHIVVSDAAAAAGQQIEQASAPWWRIDPR